MLTLEQLFNKVRRCAKKQIHTKRNFDGQAFWQPIKKTLSESQYKAKRWKKVPQSTYKSLMAIPEFVTNGYGKSEIVEVHHFLIQVVRIPKKEKPTLKKIIQIALNLGQYEGYKKPKCTPKMPDNRKQITDYITAQEAKTPLKEILSDKNIKFLKKYLKKFS